MIRPGSFFSPRRQMIYLGASLFLLASGFPFFWMVSTAFKPLREIFVFPPYFFPKEITLGGFERLFAQTNFTHYFRNSVFVASATTFLTVVVASGGAYSLTRFRYFAREKIASLVLFTYMFSPIMIIIPFYILVKKIGLVNTHLSLILANTAFCLPFSLWLLRTFFQSIPLVLEEAALVDGANRFRAVLYVVLPTALPGIIATAIFTFILAWNDYIYARILITSDKLKTLSVGVADLHNAAVMDWGMIMSAEVAITVPVLIFFIFIQRYLIAGWGAGAIR